MTHRKPYTLVRAALMKDETLFAEAVARSQRPFVQIPDSLLKMPAENRSLRYYAWATGREEGESPYLLYAGRPSRAHRSYVGNNNVLVVATAWGSHLCEKLIREFTEQTGILLRNHPPEAVVRMNIASNEAGFLRFVDDPAAFLQAHGLAFPSEKI